MYTETIAAVSTPFGRGGVALLRVSGDNACEICNKVFSAFDGKKISEHSPRYAVYGEIVAENTVIDDGIATYFKAPASYTGEDTVEICCHGGIKLAQTVLEALFAAGAEPAEAGEFTKRAFLNGKLTLSRAEAVMNLIDADTTEQVKLASSHRKGVLADCADLICKELVALISSAYAYIDYPDEDLTDVPVETMKLRLSEIEKKLWELENSYKIGRAVSEGIKTAIVGKPNAGKSSLLNSLLGEKRAIVTDIAGTTRDVIEESVSLGKIMLRLCDTAGIRETEDQIEKIGVELALDKIRDAELIFAVFDVSKPLDEEDKILIKYIKEQAGNKKIIAVKNKTDLGECKETSEVLDNSFDLSVPLSAKENVGTDELKELCEKLYIGGEINYETTAIIANSRQYAAVKRAKEAVERALTALENGFTQDIAGMDIEQALAAVGELDSRTVGEEVVNQIFSKFCVGK